MAGFKKKFVGIALAGALAVGSVAVVSAPASAANFGGYITHCSGSKKVTAKGSKMMAMPILVRVPGLQYSSSSHYSETIYLKSTASGGTWSVSGNGARSGSGYCS